MASEDTSQAAARSKLMMLAAARVVDSFHPVSSRTATPKLASMARTRRVSKRSWATSATGLKPWLSLANTQAVARCASSSASLAACSAVCPGVPGTSKGKDSARSPQRALRLSLKGSA